jgi:dTDP-glucose pyrophosphorylase
MLSLTRLLRKRFRLWLILSSAIAMDSDGTIGVRKVEEPRRFGVVKMEL